MIGELFYLFFEDVNILPNTISNFRLGSLGKVENINMPLVVHQKVDFFAINGGASMCSLGLSNPEI